MGETKQPAIRLILLGLWYNIVVFVQHNIIQCIDHKIYNYKRILLDEMDRLSPRELVEKAKDEE